MIDIPSRYEYFLSIDSNINEICISPLQYAAYKNNKEIAELLISHSACVNQNNYYGRTPIHDAAEYNSKETAELLISHGANITDKGIDGKTALHIAVLLLLFKC